MKGPLSAVRDNIQGINSRLDKAKKPISDLECKEAKKHQISIAKRKKESKK